MTRALLLAACLATACGAGDPCDGVAGTCLTVRLEPSPKVTRLDQLDLTVSFAGASGTTTTHPASGGVTTLPAALAIELGTLAAPSTTVRVAATGLVGGAIAGQGIASATVGNGDHAVVQLTLTPAECKVGSFYCGGDKLAGDPNELFRCNGTATPVSRGVCPHGCLVQPGQDDTCQAGGGVCTSGDFYCGGDKLAGDPQILYRCNGTTAPTISMECATACVIRAGQDDICQ